MFGLAWIDDRQQRHAGAERFASYRAAGEAKRLLLHDRSIASVRVVEYNPIGHRAGRTPSTPTHHGKRMACHHAM
jgi:hypothetical protein